jgi:aldose 1-epimerase
MSCHILSGGFKGFDKVIWEVTEYNKGKTPSITLKYYSKDGEEGMMKTNLTRTVTL